MSKVNNSYALARTNVKLTGNYKVTVTPDHQVTLNSISANSKLAEQRYKKFKVGTNETLSGAIARLFGNGATPSNLVYDVLRVSSDDLLTNNFSLQYEQQYTMGLSRTFSKLYDEEFSMFAPFNFKKDVPSKFAIFRVPGPSALGKLVPVTTLEPMRTYRVVSSTGGVVRYNSRDYADNQQFVADGDTGFAVDGQVEVYLDDIDLSYDFLRNSPNFKKYLEDMELVQVYDLSSETMVGKMLRDHVADRSFSTDPLFVDWSAKQAIYNGMDLVTGVMVDRVEDISGIVESEMGNITFDEYVTGGFERLGLLSSTVINMEFLFSDPSAKDYQFHRYLGLYMDELEFGTFQLDMEKMYSKSGNYPSLYPFMDCVPANYSQGLSDDGIKVVPDKSSLQGVLVEEEITDTTIVSYIKDGGGTLRKISGGILGDTYVLKDGSMDISALFHLQEPIQYRADPLTIPGRASTYLQVKGNFELGQYIDLYDPMGQLVTRLVPDHLPDWNTNSYPDYLEGDYGPGKSIGYYFYPTGTKEEVAMAIASAFNYGTATTNVLTAEAIGDRVFFRVVLQGAGHNSYKFMPLLAGTPAELYSEGFSGGTDSALSRVRVPKDLTGQISTSSYLRTVNGYCKILGISPYLEEPVLDDTGTIIAYRGVDDYLVLSVIDPKEEVLLRAGNASVHNVSRLSVGVLSFYGLKDFDFDFESSEYGQFQSYEYKKYFNVERLIKGHVYNVYRRPGTDIEASVSHNKAIYAEGSSFTATSTTFEVLTGTPVIIDQRYLQDEELREFIGFSTLSRPMNDEVQSLTLDTSLVENKDFLLNIEEISEYEFLRELDKPSLAIRSRVVPDICKWVSTIGRDIRGNPYRMNLSRAFGELNFTPSFFDRTQNPRYYTHEWPYLATQPENISREDLIRSRDYFTLPFDMDRLTSQVEDYFTDYFTLDSQIYQEGQEFSVVPIRRDVRYSDMTLDRNGRFITFFKGVEIEALPLTERANISRFEGYKFSALLKFRKTTPLTREEAFSIEVIENPTYKNLLLLITVTVDDYKVVPDISNGDFFGDYTYLYVMNSLKRWNAVNAIYDIGLEFSLPNLLSVGLFNSQSGLPVLPQITSFRGVQLPFGIDYENFNSLPSILRFGGNIPVPNYVTPINLWDPAQNKLTSTGELGRLFGMDSGGFLTITSENVYFSSTEYLFDRPNTIRSVPSIREVQLAPSGLALVNNPGQVSNANFDPVDLDDSVYKLGDVTWFYEGGGAGVYRSLSELLSFASIFDLVNDSDPQVAYKVITDRGQLQEGVQDFRLRFNQPDTVTRPNSIVPNKVTNILPELPGEVVTSYEDSQISVQHSLRRYKGAYEPKVKDVLLFLDVPIIARWALSKDTWELATYTWQPSQVNLIQATWIQANGVWSSATATWDSLGVNKSQINRNTTPMSDKLLGQNTKFDVSDPEFGMIRNHWSHRVNTTERDVLKLASPRYRSVDEIAIEPRDLYVFNSDWQDGQYSEFVDKFNSRRAYGTFNMRDMRSYLGSKVLAVPDIVTLGGYQAEEGNVDLKEIDTYTLPVRIDTSSSSYALYVDVSRRLQAHLESVVSSELSSYLRRYNILQDSVTDAISLYVSNNLIPLYKVSEYRFFTRDYQDPSVTLPLFDGTSTELTLLSSSYVQRRNFSGRMITDLSSTFTYRVPDDSSTSFALFTILEKI